MATAVTSTNTLYIDADAKMPDIQAQSAGTATWSIEFCYTGTKAKAPNVNPKYTKSVPGVSSLGQNLDVDSALSSHVVGGTAIAKAVLKGETYTVLFYIRGTNPTVGAIRDYLNSLGNAPFYFEAMIVQESTSRQFDLKDKRLPLQTFDNGFGLTQLTNPAPNYNEVFSWKANVKEGVSFYLNEKLSYGRRKITGEKAKCQKDLGAQCPPIPTLTYGNCVFTDAAGSRLTFMDAVGMKYYNGGGNFVVWDKTNHVWQFNTLNKFNKNYVQEVCRHVV